MLNYLSRIFLCGKSCGGASLGNRGKCAEIAVIYKGFRIMLGILDVKKLIANAALGAQLVVFMLDKNFNGRLDEIVCSACNSC